MKSISIINPAITEITEYLIVKARAPTIDFKSGHFARYGMCYALVPATLNTLGNIPREE